ncbi:MAG: hypothetical protein MJE68_23990, partial [Proteobacteria bacterium]|nr:hypothetical protein [Pseudomonadota bacterium]
SPSPPFPLSPSLSSSFSLLYAIGDKPKLQDLDILKLRDGSEIRIIESVTARWEKLAIRFGFEEMRICNIRRGAFFQLEDACFNMFIRWLNGEHNLKPPTWYNLIQCLEEIDEFKKLARDVKEALSF